MKGRELIEVKKQIVNSFGKSEWLELAYSIDCQDIVNGHGRLLRSLSWGDDDYDGNVLEVLDAFVKKNPENFEGIKSYLAHKASQVEVSDFISSAHSDTPKKIIAFSPQVFEVPNKPMNEKLVSVMMPFNSSFTGSFEAINKACREANLECKKANDIWENSTIIQDIFELIFTSKIVIGDFTGKNPNVFYEIGIAHTLGKIVIPITQSIDDVPADLRHHRVLKYLPNAEGYVELQKELVKRLQTLIPKSQFEW